MATTMSHKHELSDFAQPVGVVTGDFETVVQETSGPSRQAPSWVEMRDVFCAMVKGTASKIPAYSGSMLDCSAPSLTLSQACQ